MLSGLVGPKEKINGGGDADNPPDERVEDWFKELDEIEADEAREEAVDEERTRDMMEILAQVEEEEKKGEEKFGC